MSSANEEKLVRVFAGTLWQAELVKGMLDANSVPCAIKDEGIGVVTSYYASLDDNVLVVVNECDAERARRVIEENTTPEAE